MDPTRAARLQVENSRLDSRSRVNGFLSWLLYLLPTFTGLGSWASLQPGQSGAQVTLFRVWAAFLAVIAFALFFGAQRPFPSSLPGVAWYLFFAAILMQGLFLFSGRSYVWFGSWREYLGFLVATLVATTVFFILRSDPATREPFLHGFQLSFWIFGLFALLEVITGFHVLQFTSRGWIFPARSAAATFNNPNDLAVFLTLSLVALLALPSPKSQVSRMIFPLGLLTVVAFAGGSRGALLGGLVIGILVMLSYPRYRVHAIVFGGLAIWPTLVLQSALSPPAGPDQSAERRMALMGDAWELFLRAPALGSGPGSFEGFWSQRYNYPIELAAPPHSLLHELLSEYGLFVTVPLALSLAVVAVRAIRPMLSRNGADVQSFIGPSWIPALILAALLPSSVIAAPWF